MPSLLDNRKNLNPRASMEALITYARKQDHAVNILRARKVRASMFLNLALIMPIGAYVFYEFTFGYWPSIYPKNIIQNATFANKINKRNYFTPQYYLKEQDQWHKDLKQSEA